MMGIAGNAFYGALMGGRTASGLVSSLTDYGTFNAPKFAASLVSPLIPTLPAMQEVARAAGIHLDIEWPHSRTSCCPRLGHSPTVNLLGDPAGTPDDGQRLMQMATGGTGFIVDPQRAREAAGYDTLFASG